MTEVAEVANLEVYSNPQVAAHYAALDYISPCERLLFETYIRPGMAILDLGVGGGRTTPYLSQRASRYFGVDYAEEMIRLCRNRFPDLQFVVADASNLSTFQDESFDVVVFSFNGLDYLVPDHKRLCCLRECHRVLRQGGIFIFSSHNPRAVFVRPGWNRERLRTFVGRFIDQSSPCFAPLLLLAIVAKAVHSSMRAALYSGSRLLARLGKSAFWRGEGYWIDAVHGGLMTHFWTPHHAEAELRRCQFRAMAVQGDDYPQKSGLFMTGWYYYVFQKTDPSSPEGASCG